MGFVEAIARKRDGLKLDRGQIAAFVGGAARGTLPPEQLAAMLMAITCRGMDAEETAWLTQEMVASGQRWDLATLRPAAVDKHSTGGVGDTVSLILAPLCAAVGVPVAMMAGRGLGHSQGTVDKLEAVPGFVCGHDREWLLATLDRCGAAVAEQSDRIAPADRTLYALRDVTATVPSLPLIVGSIMSKKLAFGASALVLDVKWGTGAFRKTVAEARELALALRAVARAAGIRCEALITDMNQPLGPALGTACEVREALEVLSGRGDPRLREVTLALAEELGVLSGRDRAVHRRRLETALADGSALAAWEAMVRAHGGDPDPGRLPRPRRVEPVTATSEGWVEAVDGEALGWAAVEIGAGRRRREEPLAHGAGLRVLVRIGDRVERGQPLAELLVGDRPADVAALARRVRAAIRLAPSEIAPPGLVLGPPEAVPA